jgi:hypothetical protein
LLSKILLNNALLLQQGNKLSGRRDKTACRFHIAGSVLLFGTFPAPNYYAHQLSCTRQNNQAVLNINSRKKSKDCMGCDIFMNNIQFLGYFSTIFNLPLAFLYPNNI